MTDMPIPPSQPNFPPASPPPVGAAFAGAAGRPAAVAPPPSAPPVQPIYVQMPRRRHWILRTLLGVVVAVVILSVIGAIVGGGQAGSFTTRTILEGDKGQVVAVYDVSDMIDAKQAEHFRAFARHVAADRNIKAIVLRVDSGGGGVSASDEMYQEILRLRKERKIVISMGSTAASGAYYISAPADYIYAEPTTVTGSIGVISIIPIFKGTLEKIGAEALIIRSTQATPFKADLNPFETPSSAAISEHRALLDKIHQRFIKIVQDGRGSVLTAPEVVELANGRVWIGDEAVDNKLVDAIGYQDDAIAKAAGLAKLANPKAVRYTERHTLFDVFQERSKGLTIDSRLIDDLQTPRMMLLWRPQWQ
jgi:signal peptide peptidase SppA